MALLARSLLPTATPALRRALRPPPSAATTAFYPALPTHLRPYSTPSLTAAEEHALSQWIDRIRSTAETLSDVLSLNRAKQLAITNPAAPPEQYSAIAREGASLPPGYHISLFQPLFPEHELGKDGTDKAYGPPEPLVQRMWAGGSLEFVDGEGFKVGHRVSQTTEVESVERKRGNKTGEMVLVWRKITFRDEDTGEVVARVRRCHLYRRKEKRERPKVDKETHKLVAQPTAKPSPDFTLTVRPSKVTLFRFSALTFNGHRIHYDTEYTRSEEGYDDCLVHGPLTAVMLLSLVHYQGLPLLRSTPSSIGTTPYMSSFSYRATSPLVVGRDIRLCGKWGSDIDSDGSKEGTRRKKAQVWAEGQNGAIGMQGEAVVVY